jgi:radical SAM superfamily enzyme YgiQ (UPF0313 family)
VSGDTISLYRARLAREKGFVKKDWGGRVSVALAYPNFYRLGMSNLGFQIVYHLFNERSDVVAERVFLPEGQEMSLHLRAGKPLLSLESQAPLQNFDIVAFSLSFENDYPNILKILELAKIPLLAEKRSAPRPFVMAGGVTTFLNPEPLARFLDFLLLGEAEANINEFVDSFLEFAALRDDKKTFMKNLAGNVPGLYVPSLYRPEYHQDGTLRSFLPKNDRVPEKIKTCMFGRRSIYWRPHSPFHHYNPRYGIRRQDPDRTGKRVWPVVPFLRRGLRVSAPEDAPGIGYHRFD